MFLGNAIKSKDKGPFLNRDNGMNKNTEETIREHYIDVCRGIGIMFVLLGHSLCPDIITKGVFGFHMPFFFILSGILYNNSKWQQLGFKRFFKAKFKAYIIPYFVMAFINLIINIPAEIYQGLRGKELIISTAKHIFWILYSYGSSTRLPNCTPLWFLPCAFLCSIYVFLLFKIKKTSIRLLICLIAIFADFILCKAQLITLPWHLEIAMIGAVFMYIGHIIKEKVLKAFKYDAVICLMLLLMGFFCIYTNPNRIDLNFNQIENVASMFVGSAFVSIAIILFVKRYIHKNYFIELLGRNTMLIMGFNCVVNSFLRVCWSFIPLSKKIDFPWYLCFPLDLVVFFIMSLILEVSKKYTTSQRK